MESLQGDIAPNSSKQVRMKKLCQNLRIIFSLIQNHQYFQKSSQYFLQIIPKLSSQNVNNKVFQIFYPLIELWLHWFSNLPPKDNFLENYYFLSPNSSSQISIFCIFEFFIDSTTSNQMCFWKDVLNNIYHQIKERVKFIVNSPWFLKKRIINGRINLLIHHQMN